MKGHPILEVLECVLQMVVVEILRDIFNFSIEEYALSLYATLEYFGKFIILS